MIRPIITEKSMMGSSKGRYMFAVLRTLTKKDIKHKINQLFSVHVTQITTNVVKGKRKRVGKKRIEQADSLWKKAIITVKKGEKIGIFEQGEKTSKK